MLDSKKGMGGGYFLRRHPEDIPLAQVIRILDGPIAQLPCVSLNFYQKCEGCNEQQCGLHHIMAECGTPIWRCLRSAPCGIW